MPNISDDQLLKQFQAHLEKLGGLDEQTWTAIEEHSSIVSVKKEQYFVDVGNSCEYMGFVTKGLFQKYYLTLEGRKFIKEFSEENSLIGAYASYLTGEPAQFSIQALEDSVVVQFNLKKISKSIGHLVAYERLRRQIAEMVFLKREKREYEFLCLEAKGRYNAFASEFPQLLNRVPQYLIAEYLGVTPVTLNRIIKAR